MKKKKLIDYNKNTSRKVIFYIYECVNLVAKLDVSRSIANPGETTVGANMKRISAMLETYSDSKVSRPNFAYSSAAVYSEVRK
jgi:hypothetical protein